MAKKNNIRPIRDGEKVAIYWNLHKDCFSVQARSGKRVVIGHVDEFVLTDVNFNISEKGRQRVIKNKRKNVHAFIVGRWFAGDSTPFAFWQAVTYNPYKHTTFVDKTTEAPVTEADLCSGIKESNRPAVIVGSI